MRITPITVVTPDMVTPVMVQKAGGRQRSTESANSALSIATYLPRATHLAVHHGLQATHLPVYHKHTHVKPSTTSKKVVLLLVKMRREETHTIKLGLKPVGCPSFAISPAQKIPQHLIGDLFALHFISNPPTDLMTLSLSINLILLKQLMVAQ